MVGQSHKLNQGWPTSESLLELMDDLKQAGYNIGVEQYIAAQDLVLALMAQDKPLDSPESLRDLLGPLLCSSPIEQADFQHRFSQWAERIGLLADPVKPTDPQAEKLSQELRTLGKQRRRWWRVALVLIIALVLSIGIFQVWFVPEPELDVAPTTQVEVPDAVDLNPGLPEPDAVEPNPGLPEPDAVEPNPGLPEPDPVSANETAGLTTCQQLPDNAAPCFFLVMRIGL